MHNRVYSAKTSMIGYQHMDMSPLNIRVWTRSLEDCALGTRHSTTTFGHIALGLVHLEPLFFRLIGPSAGFWITLKTVLSIISCATILFIATPRISGSTWVSENFPSLEYLLPQLWFVSFAHQEKTEHSLRCEVYIYDNMQLLSTQVRLRTRRHNESVRLL